MENHHYSSLSIKLAIGYLPNLSQKLLGIRKPYEKLLLEILKLDPDGYEPFPTDKEMIKDLGITTNMYRKWMHQIYADVIEMLENVDSPKLEIKKLEHYISCYEQDKRFFFVTTLPETPRVGSPFYVDFFRPIYKNNHFYVDSITYRVFDGKMIVDVRLRTDFFNRYVKFKEDQEEYEAHQKGSWYWWNWIKKKYGE